MEGKPPPGQCPGSDLLSPSGWSFLSPFSDGDKEVLLSLSFTTFLWRDEYSSPTLPGSTLTTASPSACVSLSLSVPSQTLQLTNRGHPQIHLDQPPAFHPSHCCQLRLRSTSSDRQVQSLFSREAFSRRFPSLFRIII